MARRIPTPNQRGYTPFAWTKPQTWWGRHDDPSMFKTAADNNLIRFEQFRDYILRQKDLLDPKIEQLRGRRLRGYKNMFKDMMDRISGYTQETGGFLSRVRGDSAKARKAFERDMSRAISAFRTGRSGYYKDSKQAKKFLGEMLERWQKQYPERVAGLKDVKTQQQRMMAQLENAPSSVAEQAQQIADQKLKTATALAATTGGSAGTQGMDLRNQASTQFGDLLKSTSVARMQEKLGFLGARQNLMGQQLGTEMALTGLAESDAAKLKGVSQDYRQFGMDKFNIGKYGSQLYKAKAEGMANLNLNLMDQMRQAETRRLGALQQGGQDAFAAHLAQLGGWKYEGEDLTDRFSTLFGRALANRADDRTQNYNLWAGPAKFGIDVASKALGAYFGGGGYGGGMPGFGSPHAQGFS